MIAHGVRNPWDLTEFDQWVNDATRKDIATVALQHNCEVFGLHMWDPWTKIRGRALVDTLVLNFSVSLIFKNEDEPKVDQLISEYKKAIEKQWSMAVDRKLVDKLHKIALMSCTWV